MIKVVHISPRIQGRGGVEALHEIHRRWPIAQEFIALFDRDPIPRAGYTNLNFTWRTPLWLMRRRFAAALSWHPDSLVIYHNGWGLPFLQDLDGASRRAVFFHTSPKFGEIDFAALHGLIDGAIGVTPAWAQSWNEMSPDRTLIIHAPVEPPAEVGRRERTASEPLVLGFAGRLEREHKRLDRLPTLIEELKKREVKFRFEVLGEGTMRAELENKLGHEVSFHGWASPEKLWSVMAGWDAIVFFSDMEGGPISLFEGMALGVLPFYPTSGGSWGDLHTPEVDPLCYYPQGDMAALAEAIQQTFARERSELARLRTRSMALMAPYRPEKYNEALLQFVAKIAELPRMSAARVHRGKLGDFLPLGIVTRFALQWLRRS